MHRTRMTWNWPSQRTGCNSDCSRDTHPCSAGKLSSVNGRIWSRHSQLIEKKDEHVGFPRNALIEPGSRAVTGGRRCAEQNAQRRLIDCPQMKCDHVNPAEGVIVCHQGMTGKKVTVPMHFHIIAQLKYLSTFGTTGFLSPKLAPQPRSSHCMAHSLASADQ